MGDLVVRLENLSPARRKLLERMSSKQQRQAKVYPLSSAQQRLWFIDQLDPGNAAYNMPESVRLTGELNKPALRRAWREIIRRHEILRTCFPQRNGVAVQEVMEVPENVIEEIDLRFLPSSERLNEANRLTQQEAETPFNLAAGPLFRIKLLQLDEQDHAMLVSMHHIVSDGWSLSILENEFGSLYKAFCAGENSPLPELKLQYGNYAVWQRGWLQSETCQKQLAYWKQQLAGAEKLELPTDFPPLGKLSGRGGSAAIEFPDKLSNDLKELCRREEVTLFMVFLAAFQLVLARFSGQPDIVVGTPIANRNRVETENLIGILINTLLLRTQVSSHLTLRELLAQVRQTTLEGYERQDTPFEKLVEELQPVHDLARTPLFQVLFALQNFPEGTLELPGLKMSGLELSLNVAKLELSLMIVERGSRLIGGLQCDESRFNLSTAKRLVRHLQLVLEAMITDIEQRVCEVSLLTIHEKNQILLEWNDTFTEYPRETCVHELFAAQAAQTPSNVAVTCEGRQFTYAELDSRSNQLACYLQKLGAGAETRIGICMERSLEMFVGALGAMKAAAAYVPLDPAYPPERLQYMIKDADLVIILIHNKTRRAAFDQTVRIINLDEEWLLVQDENSQKPAARCFPENLAYVTYTSGSTGKPKGVSVSHRSVCNQLAWTKHSMDLQPSDRFLQKASFSFDGSILEIFLPLITGAQIVSARPGGEQDLDYLVDLVADQQVTCIDLVPSLLEGFLEHPRIHTWTSVRLIMCGGEALKPVLVRLFKEKLPSTTLWNTYGPTETTVQSVVADSQDDQGNISIGKPIWNTQVYVVDEIGGLSPVGVSGELHIGGEGVARGYLNRPELTAERFVPDPFGEHLGMRLYRTGDLVRWREDGTLEFFGRVDQQVKIRGFRVELGEIETALLQQPGVQEAVVTLHDNTFGGNRQLLAYIVPQPGVTLKSDDLRRRLRDQLPAYMVPAACVFLEALPLTRSGKIDRKSLPVPEIIAHDEARQAPRTVTEEILCGIWEQVLKQVNIGRNDHFFELGGHSLLAMRLISRIRNAFSIELPLRVLFESPTVAGLAERIEQERGQDAAVRVPPIMRASRDLPLPLSYAQQRLWFIDQLEPGSSTYNIPIAVRLRGALNVEALRWSLQEIVRRHEVLRTRIVRRQDQPYQEILDNYTLEIAESDLSPLEPEAREQQAIHEAQVEAGQPFDLSAGPLLRCRLLRLNKEKEDHVLLLTMHHIVSDGWSMGVLDREFTALYQAYCEGQPESPLPELEIQYADFAVWQRQWLQGEVLERQVEYWKKQLAGAAPLDMPTDRPRQALASHAGAAVSWELSEELSSALKELGRQEGVTLFMVLLAAFQLVLSRYSRQQDIAVGTPVAGRTLAETEGLIGFFVNTLVLRTDVSRGGNFRELLQRVREVTLDAYAHQDLPFEKLVEELQPERNLSRSPLFQVMFVLQNAPSAGVELPGVKLSGLAGGSGRTEKFEMTLAAGEGGKRIGGELSYRKDLFEETTIRHLLGHLENLLQEVVRGPERALSEVSMLSAQERCQVVHEWNVTQAYQPRHCIHELFAAQAARTPQAEAVIYEGRRMQYAELEQRSNQLARRLRTLGVGPESRVGLCLERSLEMVVAVLGVLKAGGAYVPLDPSYPPDRLNYILADAEIQVLVTQPGQLLQESTVAAKILKLDAELTEIAGEEVTPLPVCTDVENAAYLIYTSGSTGRPKGTVVTHCNVARLMEATDRWFGFDESDSWTLFHSYAFDFSVWEIWGALLKGGRLVVVPYWTSRSPEQFYELLEREQITVLNQTPSAFRQLMQAEEKLGRSGAGLKLRTVIFGGEALDYETLRPWFQRHGDAHPELINMYGITETTVHVTWRRVRTKEIEGGRESLIGERIPDLRLYILDEALQPVPVGVPGELFVAGAGLARGYWKRAELTAQRFIPDSFGGEPGARLYRTGDLARWRADSDIEYMGRIDQQVKIRGFRIELGEIQSALEQYEGVRQALVVVREDGAGEKKLVAYVIPDPQVEKPDISSVRSHLKDKLPDYMVPAVMMELESLPLTLNGKIDRNALPDPEKIVRKASVAPRDLLELELARIWQQVLNIEGIGIHDNFFDLGGHSLLAVRLVSAVEQTLQQKLPVATLFQHSTIEQLADYLRHSQSMVPGSPLVKIRSGSRKPLFFVHGAGGSAFKLAGLARRLHPEQPFFAFHDPALEQGLTGEVSIQSMAGEYIKAMQAVQPEGPYLLGGWSMGGVIAFEMARQLCLQNQEVALLAMVESYLFNSQVSDDQGILNSFLLNLGFSTDDLGLAGDAGDPLELRLQKAHQLALQQGIFPSSVDLTAMRRFFEVFCAHVHALANFHPLPAVVPAHQWFAADMASSSEQAQARWRKYLLQVDVEQIPGDHFTVLQEPNVAVLSEKLTAALQKATSGTLAVAEAV